MIGLRKGVKACKAINRLEWQTFLIEWVKNETFMWKKEKVGHGLNQIVADSSKQGTCFYFFQFLSFIKSTPLFY